MAYSTNERVLDIHVLNHLKQCPWFEYLSESQLLDIQRETQLRKFKKGDFVSRKGDESSGVFGIIKGTAKISFLGRSGSNHAVTIYGEDDWFGEIACIDGGLESLDIIALESCHVLFIPREIVIEKFDETPLSYKLLFVRLTRKVRWLFQFIEDTTELPLASRLARRLLHLLKYYGTESPEGIMLELEISQADLASLANGSRQKANQVLKHWESLGIIRYRHRSLCVLNLQLLKDEAEASSYDFKLDSNES